MAIKLGKKTFPAGHSPSDFKCFGPAATKDGDFESVKVADLGCFSQGEGIGSAVDSNKYYHGAVVQSTKDSIWFAYFEWGRTGKSNPDFQFVQCSSEAEAQKEFVSQLRSKNDKRGMWTTIAGLKTLTAKPGKDCYLVRPQATRSTGLPDARTIRCDDGSKVVATPVTPTTGKKKAKAPSVSIDPKTLQLLNDLNMGTISYTKGAMADSSIPTQTSIEDARTLLGEATKLVGKIGDNVEAQVANKDLVSITSLLYSRIPKIKPLHAAASSWILSQNNIVSWGFDLDAFEQALYATNASSVQQANPLDDMGIEMVWVDGNTEDGKWVHNWLPKATRNQHHGLGNMHIKGVWKVKRSKLSESFDKAVTKIGAQVKGKPTSLAMHQAGTRHTEAMKQANVSTLFHGSRSANISGILRTGLRVAKQLKGKGISINGAMFGNSALYFGSDWKKSSGYCSLKSSYWAGGSGGIKGRDAFMFVSSVIVGNPHIAKAAYGFTEPPNGTHSVFGKAGTTSGLKNDEHMVYDLDYHTLDYLVEFSA